MCVFLLSKISYSILLNKNFLYNKEFGIVIELNISKTLLGLAMAKKHKGIL